MVPQEILKEVMKGKMIDWDRNYQDKMIPVDTLGLEILSGQLRLLHLCVQQWQKYEKSYGSEARREQIMSLAEECGYTDS